MDTGGECRSARKQQAWAKVHAGFAQTHLARGEVAGYVVIVNANKRSKTMTNINDFTKALEGRKMTTTIGARSGDGQSIDWIASDMPAEALLRIFEYGAQRIFNDRVGGSDSTVEAKVEAARGMIEAFKRGEVRRTAGAGGMAQDDKDLIAAVRALLDPDAKKKLAALERDVQLAKCQAIRDANEGNRKAVDAQLKLIRDKRKATSIDIGDIGL